MACAREGEPVERNLGILHIRNAARLSSCARRLLQAQQSKPILLFPAPAHAAANNTWWNIYSSSGSPLALPECAFGPQLNFVGSLVGPPVKGDWGLGAVARLMGGTSGAAGNRHQGASGVTESKPGVGTAEAAQVAAGAAPKAALPLFPGFCANQVSWWVEQRREGAALHPPDLHAAMTERRLRLTQNPSRRQA